MLPFLQEKKKSIADVIVNERRPDEPIEKSTHSDGMLAAAQDLISAVHAKDHKAVADALQAAHEMAQEYTPEMPDEQGEV